jgi:hypothetical protein
MKDRVATPDGALDDEAIRALVTRLARPHRSGGRVIERAALLAAGADFGAVMTWIEAHGGEPEEEAPARASHGLHGARFSAGAGTSGGPPRRLILPATALH